MMGSALTYSGVTLYPKGGNRSSKCLPVQTEWEATRGFFGFCFFFFFVSSAFAVSLPLAAYVGHQGWTSVRSRNYRPLRALCGMEVAPVSCCQQPHQVEGTRSCRKDRSLGVAMQRGLHCLVWSGPPHHLSALLLSHLLPAFPPFHTG